MLLNKKKSIKRKWNVLPFKWKRKLNAINFRKTADYFL